MGETRFRVEGITPAPQAGTTRYPTGGVVTIGGKNLPLWRQAVTNEASVALVGGQKHRGPIAVAIDFRFPMPRTARTAAQKRAGQMPMTVQPDLDKLIRAVFDSLTNSQLIVDDRQISVVHASKTEHWDSWIGADISVEDLWCP